MANPITQIILTAVDKTKAAFAAAKGGLTSLGEAGANLKTQLGSIFAGLSVVGFIGQIKHVANEIDDAKKAAEGAGTGLQKFSALTYASGQSGGGPDVLQKSLVKLVQSLHDSQDEGSAAAAMWRDLKIDPKQFNDSSDALLVIADRFKAMPDGIAKTNLAVDLFGEKIGPKMIPLLNQGADGIRALMEEGRQLGKVFDDEVGAAAERLNDTLDRLNASKTKLFAKALPSLEQWVSALDDILERGTALDKIAFFTTGYINEDTLNRITDAGQRVQEYSVKIFELQQQLLELRRVEGEDSPNVGIWEKRIAALEKTRADLAKRANADRVSDSAKTNDALGKDYEADARNFKRAQQEKISDAERLQKALRTAFSNALEEERKYTEEARGIREKANQPSIADKDQGAIRYDATLATMKLERIKSTAAPEEIRAQAAEVKRLAAALEDAAYQTRLFDRATLAESDAAEKSAAAARELATGLAEQMKANEERLNGLNIATEAIGKTPIKIQVEKTPELEQMLANLNEIEAAIGRVNKLKISPGTGNGADNIANLLRNESLKYGRRG